MTEERKQQLTNVDPKMLEALAWKYEDKKANPKVDVREPLLLVGSMNDWSPEDAKKSHAFVIAYERNRSELLGGWHISEDKILCIVSGDGGTLSAKIELWPGVEVGGDLVEERDGWRSVDLNFSDGNALGNIRLRWDQVHERAVSRFKFAAETEWGPENLMERAWEDEEAREVEHRVMLHVQPGSRLAEFQVISDRSLWDWRVYPAKEAKSLVLKIGEKESVPAAISVDKDDMSYHGRNFAISERKGGTFTIRVLLKRRGRFVWYSKGEDMPPPQQAWQMPGGDPRSIPQPPWGAASLSPLGAGVQEAWGAPEQLPEVQVLKHPKECVIDMIVPVRLVGDFISWDTKAPGCELFADPFHAEDDWQPYRLQVRLTDGRLDFQIASSRYGLQWRCHPERAKNGVCVLENYGSGEASPGKIGGERDGEGRCFSIREQRGTLVAIFVWLRAEPMPLHMGIGNFCTEVKVAYERVPGSPGKCISFGMNPQANYRISQIEPVRLVGEFVKWNTRAPGLQFKPRTTKDSDEWQEYCLCCRLQGDRLDFQIVSSNLGFDWRCYPKACQRGICTIPRGAKNNIEVAIGGKKDGHGMHFRVEEPVFTVVTLRVRLRPAPQTDVGLGPRCGEVMVTYSVEDTGLTVGIGPSHVQFPLKKRR